MLPSVQERVEVKQTDQKGHHDIHSKPRHFDPGQHVVVRDRRPIALTAWVPGATTDLLGQDARWTVVEKTHLRISSQPDLQEDSAPYPSAPSTTDVSPDTCADPPTSHSRTSTPPRRYPTGTRRSTDWYADTYMHMWFWHSSVYHTCKIMSCESCKIIVHVVYKFCMCWLTQELWSQ